MKTKSISKTMPAASLASLLGTSVKKTFFLFLLVFSLIPNMTKAQSVTGVLTGTGMAMCSPFSFSTTSGITTSPGTYGSQTFFCTGTTKDDIDFTSGPSGFRVQKSLWSFIPNTTMTLGILAGDDEWGGPISPISLSPNDVVLPCCYATTTTGVVMQFSVNSTITTGTYLATTWTITAD